MSKNQSCIFVPYINNDPSELYLGLQKQFPNMRPFINYIYACYSQPSIQQAMDNAGFTRNPQGQHKVKDVITFMHIDDYINDFSNLNTIEIQAGFKDALGNRTDYTDALVTLQEADKFNASHKTLVASVYKHGNAYNIVVSEKTADTFRQEDVVKERLSSWNICLQVFNAAGIDLNSLPQEAKDTVNPYNRNFISYLRNLQNLSAYRMYKKDALILFSMNQNSQQVQRLIQRFGSIEAAAQTLHDYNMGNTTLSSTDRLRLQAAIDYCKKLQGIDLIALQTQIDQTNTINSNSNPNDEIQLTLYDLYTKYKININEIVLINKNIHSLSEAAEQAVTILNRQLKILKAQKGNNTQGKQLASTMSSLLREINNKKYYMGLLQFLDTVSKDISSINTMLQNIPQSGTELEKAFAAANTLQKIQELRECYYSILDALSSNSLIIDESIDQTNINDIRDKAQKLKDYFSGPKGIDPILKRMTEETMIKIMTQIVGNTSADGMNIASVIKMAAKDSSMMNWLYGIGEQSNPIIAAMGNIIRNAQNSRDVVMKDIALRIRKATDKLYKAGYNSEFMYEDDSHIISDIDWELYEKTRKRAIIMLRAQGLKGFDLKQAIENWEDQNTEDRVVDNTNGRTEKVPNKYFRKPFPQLAQEQQEYYDTMMRIKGELGSLLPKWAQQQYLPPQIRRKMLDAIGKAKNAKDVVSAVSSKVSNIWKNREDNEEFVANGIEFQETIGTFDNTPLKQIPIFYVNKVEQGELLKNFSTGLQHLAGTAINYDAMSKVVHVAEFMGTFAKEQMPRSDKNQGDIVSSAGIRIVKQVFNFAKNTNTESIVNGFIDQHFYGMTLKQSQQKSWTQIAKSLIAYTSFRGLATNVKGMTANTLVGIYQIFIECGCGEFFGLKDLVWAVSKLFGKSGIEGEIMECLSNNKSHKATLFKEMFDPEQENFENLKNTKYYKSIFRRLFAHDLSFAGYQAGEYLIHLLPMYAILHKNKLRLNGKRISVYDAFELSPLENGNATLIIKQGVTTLKGKVVDQGYINKIRNRVKYVNQAMHGAMNTEDKGIIHQYMLGRAIMNFRQWMVRHYSRRYRGRHWDATLEEMREGYWVSLFKMVLKDRTKDAFEEKKFFLGMYDFIKDCFTFITRASLEYNNLEEDQKYNVRRALSEIILFVTMLGLSFALGDPDDHKKEFWRRWWIYQTKRIITEEMASMPTFGTLNSILTIFRSPIACINTLNNMFYIVTGLGDIDDVVKKGKHKGENLYWYHVKKYTLPFYKDYEQMQKLMEDDTIFRVLDSNSKLSNY